MTSYYVWWLDEEPLITILYALKPLNKDTRIIIIDKIIDYMVNKEIADTILYESYNPYDDWDYFNHDYDYLDGYYTD